MNLLLAAALLLNVAHFQSFPGTSGVGSAPRPHDVAGTVPKPPVDVDSVAGMFDVSTVLNSACLQIHAGDLSNQKQCVDNLKVKAGLGDVADALPQLTAVVASLPVGRLADLEALAGLPLPLAQVKALVGSFVSILLSPPVPSTDRFEKLVKLSEVQNQIAAQIVEMPSLSPEEKAHILLSNSALKMDTVLPAAPTVAMPTAPAVAMPGMPAAPAVAMPGMPAAPTVAMPGMPAAPAFAMPGMPTAPAVAMPGMPAAPAVALPDVPLQKLVELQALLSGVSPLELVAMQQQAVMKLATEKAAGHV